MSIFEALMLLCFGIAWPVSIYKSVVSKTAKGKSLPFLGVVFLGYIFGTIHKLLYSKDWVIILYILNGILVLSDILITLRNRRLDQERTQIVDQEKNFL